MPVASRARLRIRFACPAIPALLLLLSPAIVRAQADERFTGSAACRACHEQAWQAWSGSHHARAMMEPAPAAVLGDFDGARFEHDGIESVFRKERGAYLVRTQGPDGKPHDYKVRYTFGVDPLQQLLLELPGGRLQAFSVAWDSRPGTEGGQRWFHLLPNEKAAPGDALHWTGYLQNWNLQCAHCHSTALHKNFDPKTGSYATSFAEMNVACEACHGPGRAHAEWAKTATPPYGAGDAKGFDRPLQSRDAAAWRFADQGAAIAVRSAPPPDSAVAVCAPCHSRRTLLDEDAPPSASLYEGHRPAWLADPLYYADGQQRDEVYVWGSFLQSKMFRRGVVCSDCHDSHSQQLRAEGNALCSTCHRSEVFDTPAHHHHAAGGSGSRCVVCHMPARNYMLIDARRDHALQVPRPDLAAEIGAPDACTSCHAGNTAAWAAESMDRFYGKAWRQRPAVARTIHEGWTRGTVGARALLALAGDTSQAAFVRASALAAARAGLVPSQAPVVESMMRDGDAGVRLAALDLAERIPADRRLAAVAPLLGDPVRTVRAAAAVLLADAPAASLPPSQQTARNAALEEYVASQRLNADQPFANVNLGNLYARQQRFEEARAAFERAIAIDARDAAAYVNLADLDRALGDDAGCEAVLARGLAVLPQDAGLRHARGLLLVRRGKAADAIADFEAAVRLDPRAARYPYVHAVALDSLGRRDDAIAVLKSADQAHPFDVDILGALVSMLVRSNQHKAALDYARALAQAVPDDPGVTQLVTALASSPD